MTRLSLALCVPALLGAQEPRTPRRLDDDSALAAVLTRALLANPGVRATAARTAAARARIAPAGSRPDPMLMSGLQNFPLFRPGFSEEMTMKMVGLSQTVLFPGKRRLSRTVAAREAEVSAAEDQAARASLVTAVRTLWYEIAYLDAALALTRRQRDVLDGVVDAALARYNAGAGGQADVLSAQIDAAKARDDERGVRAERETAVAALNALLDRDVTTPVEPVRIATRLQRAAFAGRGDSGQVSMPGLPALQARAARESPALVVQTRAVDAQASRVALARRETRPDFDVVLQYGQRDRAPDMLTVQVAIPLRLQHRTKQGALVAAAESDAIALEAERSAQRNEVASTVARLSATIDRARARLALYESSVLPQRRAAVDATLATYRTGGATLTQVLSAQAALLNDSLTVARTLSEFAQSIAALELVVGTEVLP